MWETGSHCPAMTQRRAMSAGKPLGGVQPSELEEARKWPATNLVTVRA